MNLNARRILVLNAGYEPLGLTSIRRGVVLVQSQTADAVIESKQFLHTPSRRIPVPSVIRLKRMVRRPQGRLSLNRHNILRRDGYTCQYCGRRGRVLTIDHVVPRSRGGQDTWENLVTACLECNTRKGDRTPEEAGMPLLRRPRPPSYLAWITFEMPDVPEEWAQFLPQFRAKRVYAD
ncbi:HNH endonuclease [Oceanithermus sp.]